MQRPCLKPDAILGHVASRGDRFPVPTTNAQRADLSNTCGAPFWPGPDRVGAFASAANECPTVQDSRTATILSRTRLVSSFAQRRQRARTRVQMDRSLGAALRANSTNKCSARAEMRRAARVKFLIWTSEHVVRPSPRRMANASG